MIKNNDKTFCKLWKNALPSEEVLSSFNNPEPTNNCNTIDAVTIGPIPRLNIAPNFAPNIMDSCSNWASGAEPNPNNGIIDNTKNDTKIIKVHLSFSLKPNFPSGHLTSGRYWSMLVRDNFTTLLLDFFYCIF